MVKIRELIVALAAIVLLCAEAKAQTYRDSGGSIPTAVVPLIGCSSSGLCSGPVSTATPMPVAIVSGGGGGGSVTQGTSPWVDNITQFGGSNVVTGVGVGGAGIPRITVSSDSSLSLTGTLPAFASTPTVNLGAPAVGGANFVTNQWSNATGSATQIFAARTGAPGTGRISLTLYNTGSVTVYYGAAGVTSSTGTTLLPGGSRTIYTTAAIYGVPASGTGTLAYDETY